MGLGALLALAILLLFGKTAKTDGLFTAYGVYGLLLMVAQSLRTTIPSRLVEGEDMWSTFDGYLGAILSLVLVSLVPLVALGGPLAHLLTGDAAGDSHDSARRALWLFSVAGGAQLLAGLGAAALGALDRFITVSIAYLAAGAASIVVLLALAAPFDVTAVPVGVAVGAVVGLVLIGRSLLIAGWRPSRAVLPSLAHVGRRAWIALSGSALYAASQAMFVISLALAARMDSGAATLYTYAFFATAFIVGASSGSVAMVLAAPLAQSWNRVPSSLTPHLRRVVRLGVTLTLPILGIAAIAGDDLAVTALGSKLSPGDAGALAGSFVGLAGYMLAMVAVTVPLLAAFALSRYAAVAVVGAGAVAIHAGLSVIAATTDRLEALAIAGSVSTILMLVGVLLIVFGRGAAVPIRAVVVELAPPAGVAAVSFVAAWCGTLVTPGRGAAIAWAIAGTLLYAALVRRYLPRSWELVLVLLAPLERAVGPRLAGLRTRARSRAR
jgi:O-antigen/teichoic acid export membrane protein